MYKKIKIILRLIILRPISKFVLYNYRLSVFFDNLGLKKLSIYLLSRSLKRYGVEICYGAKLSNTVKFPHPTSIVIGGGARIGNNVIIHQGVTLGASNFDFEDQRGIKCNQSVSQYTILGAGCKILGDVKIGSRCIIGANSIVTKDVPDHTIVTGVNEHKSLSK